jgi:hypothetical protein
LNELEEENSCAEVDLKKAKTISGKIKEGVSRACDAEKSRYNDKIVKM